MQQQNYYINTLKGKWEPIEQLVIMSHESLFHNLSNQYVPQPNNPDKIECESLRSIINNPSCCLTNLSFNDVEEMAHELQSIKVPLLIVDYSSNYEKLIKLQQLCPNVIIATGLQIDTNIKDTTDNLVLYSVENIIKKIQFEITLGSNEGIKPAFIGEVGFANTQIFLNHLEASFYASQTYGIPIFIKYNSVLEQLSEKYPNSKLVIVNPPIEVAHNASVLEETRKITNILQIEKLLEKYYVVFDLLYYQQTVGDVLLRGLISHLQTSNKILVSNGAIYKTQLKKYGGLGYEYMLDLIDYKTGNSLTQNSINLLQWAQETILIQEKKIWICPQCSQEFDDSLEKFKKFGKEFCSIKCLKAGIK